MVNRKLSERLILALIFVFFVFSKNAEAYIEPGTTTYLLQILIAFLAGGIYAIKIFWNKIKMVFIALFTKKMKTTKNKKNEDLA